MFSLSLPEAVYGKPSQSATFYRDLVERLNRLPGAVSASGVMIPPVAASGFGGTFSIEGRAQLSGVAEPRAQLRPIAPGYFHMLGVPVLAGRDFTERDGAGAQPVAIISEAAARRFWPGENPVGRHLRMHVSAVSSREPDREIVGIVGDVKTAQLDAPFSPVVYVPHPQHAAGFMTILLRTSPPPETLTSGALAVVHELDPALAPIRIRTLDEQVAASRADQRFRAVLLGLFAGASFLLAMAGLYAVVAYSTTRRRHEIGVRMALGATSGDIKRLIVSEGMRPVATGVLGGCILAVSLSRAMTGLLFGVRPVEPAILVLVSVLLAAAAGAACYLPARRAATADPRETLRAE
jgi:putative ABC transport system permease protein